MTFVTNQPPSALSATKVAEDNTDLVFSMNQNLQAGCSALSNQGKAQLLRVSRGHPTITRHCPLIATGSQCWKPISDCNPPDMLAIQDVDPGIDYGDRQGETGETEVFFKILDPAKSFSHLTVLGDTSGMIGVDLLLHKFTAIDLQWGPQDNKLSNAKAMLIPSNCILSVTSFEFSFIGHDS